MFLVVNMLQRRVLPIAVGALLLILLPNVVAHGDEHNVEPMEMTPQEAPEANLGQDKAATSYWSLNEHAALMYWHIGLEILAWIVILPVGMWREIIGVCWSDPTNFLSCHV